MSHCLGHTFKVGDRVKHGDAELPTSIPAYRAMRGTVVAVDRGGYVSVHWDCDDGAIGFRDPNDLDHATELS